MMNKATNLQGEEYVVMTRPEYDTLIADTHDGGLIDAARAEACDRPTMDQKYVMATLSGEMHPLTGWRKTLNLTMTELAEKAQVRKATISDLENDKLDPRYSTLRAIATALNLEVSDIIE
jgi:DNA-binding XRE family transcriptional regulator